MQNNALALVPLAAPLALLFYALYSLVNKKMRNGPLSVAPEIPTLFGISIAFGSIIMISVSTEMSSLLLGLGELGFSVRLDMLSTIMLAMISILAFVILRFSKNYMDGDPRKHVFISRLAATIASVELLVLSNNLFQLLVFWIITSICLHYLLVFYRHRPQAIAAARKKFIVARIGDLSLLAAVAILYTSFNTGDFNKIFTVLEGGSFDEYSVSLAAFFLVSAALFKSAQFPSHGWLIEVVETPTPVSALLHAGLLNAGPFLMVRFSFLMAEATSASVLLIIVGGFTALVASVIYLTQPSIKVSLGYSSVAHMGFSLLLSGIGLYAAAILHIIAHSFYKAHAFLSSGSVIDDVKSQRIKQVKRLGHPVLIILSIITSSIIFLGSAYISGVNLTENLSLLFIALVIIMSLSQFIVQVMDSRNSGFLLLQSIVVSSVVAFSFLGFEHLTRALLANQLPILEQPAFSIQIAMTLLLLSFTAVILLQIASPLLKDSKLAYRWGIHLRNGFYANVVFDRIIGSLKPEKFRWANLAVQEEDDSLDAPQFENDVLIKRSEILINN